MFASFKSEIRKLLTVRSTYIFLGLAVLFTLFFAGYIEGYKLIGPELQNPHLLTADVIGALTNLPMVFVALVAILLMAHEYRHNLIMYTLTSSNSRTKVLVSKILAVTLFALGATVLIGVLSPVASYWGVHLHGHTLVPQIIDYHSLVWRALFNGWAFVMLGLLLATIIRNQVGAIVSLLIVGPVEALLGLLLKNNVVYLPFTALNSVLQAPMHGALSYGHAALVVGAWLTAGWIVAWILFLRRDAN